MSDPRTTNDAEMLNKKQQVYAEALKKFERGKNLMHRRAQGSLALKVARNALKNAKTLEQFRAAAPAFHNTATDNESIRLGRKEILTAEQMCKTIDDEVQAHFANVSSAAPAGGPAAPVVLSAKAAPAPRDKTKHVVLSAPANVQVEPEPHAGGSLLRVVKSQGSYCDPTPAKPVLAGSGKRPVQFVDLTMSSDDEETKKPLSKKPAPPRAMSNAEGKAPAEDVVPAPPRAMSNAEGKAPAEDVVHADVMGRPWHNDIVEAMRELVEMKRLSFDDMSNAARKQLSAMEAHHGVILLQKVRDEPGLVRMATVNSFMVKCAQKIRMQSGLDDVDTVLNAMDIYAWDSEKNAWRPQIVKIMHALKEQDKYSFSLMDFRARQYLVYMRADLAEDCLRCVLDEPEKIEDVNHFVAEKAMQLNEEAGYNSDEQESGDDDVDKAWNYYNDTWRPEIQHIFAELKEKGIWDSDKQSSGTMKKVGRLPLALALQCLGKLRTVPKDTPIDVFVYKLADKLYEQYKGNKPDDATESDSGGD